MNKKQRSLTHFLVLLFWFSFSTSDCLAIDDLESKDDSKKAKVAVTFEVRGGVWSGKDSNKQITAQKQLEPAVITLDAGATLLLAYNSTGAMERLSADRRVTTVLTHDGATPADGLKITKIPGKVPTNSLAFLPTYTAAGAGHARSDIDPPGPAVKPIHNSVILTDQPVLSWSISDAAPADQKQYNVYVMKGTRKKFGGTTKQNQLQLTKKLRAGKYSWKITLPLSNGEEQEVAPVAGGNDQLKTFRVATPELVEEATELLKLADDNSDDAGLVRFCALRLEHLNMLEQSTQLYRRALAINENDVTSLAALNELYRRAGRLDEAAVARAAAVKLGYEFEKAKE